jgi:hypothetical protein
MYENASSRRRASDRFDEGPHAMHPTIPNGRGAADACAPGATCRDNVGVTEVEVPPREPICAAPGAHTSRPQFIGLPRDGERAPPNEAAIGRRGDLIRRENGHDPLTSPGLVTGLHLLDESPVPTEEVADACRD